MTAEEIYELARTRKPVPCRIYGVLSRFSGGKWAYSLELREVKSDCVIIAGLEEVEVEKNG